MLGRRTGSIFLARGRVVWRTEASAASPSLSSCKDLPLELNDRNWRGAVREGGREQVLTPHLPLNKKHFTFVDTASVESRRPRLAARRDPRLIVFEKSRDFATLCVLFKLLLFCNVFILKAGTNWTCSAAHAHTRNTHASKKQRSFPGSRVSICRPPSPAVVFTARH